MKQHLYISKEPNLQIIVVTSIALHLLFITLVTAPFKTKEREYKSYFVNIVAPVEVQATAKTPAVKKAGETEKKSTDIKVKPSPRRRVKPKKGVSLEPEKTVSKEIERLRAISNISKQKNQEENKAVSQAVENIRKEKHVAVSNKAAMHGTQTDANFNAYSALIQRKVFNEWIHPLIDSYLEAVLSFNINKRGIVSSYKIEKSSGNTKFDKSAINAIKKASPLPAPPVEQSVEIRFHL